MLEGCPAKPWEPDEKRVNKLVFIGRNLDEDALRKAFNGCLLWILWSRYYEFSGHALILGVWSCERKHHKPWVQNRRYRMLCVSLLMFASCSIEKTDHCDDLRIADMLDRTRDANVKVCVYVSGLVPDLWIEKLLLCYSWYGIDPECDKSMDWRQWNKDFMLLESENTCLFNLFFWNKRAFSTWLLEKKALFKLHNTCRVRNCEQLCTRCQVGRRRQPTDNFLGP